jgi:hypothetical protein
MPQKRRRKKENLHALSPAPNLFRQLVARMILKIISLFQSSITLILTLLFIRKAIINTMMLPDAFLNTPIIVFFLIEDVHRSLEMAPSLDAIVVAVMVISITTHGTSALQHRSDLFRGLGSGDIDSPVDCLEGSRAREGRAVGTLPNRGGSLLSGRHTLLGRVCACGQSADAEEGEEECVGLHCGVVLSVVFVCTCCTLVKKE